MSRYSCFLFSVLSGIFWKKQLKTNIPLPCSLENTSLDRTDALLRFALPWVKTEQDANTTNPPICLFLLYYVSPLSAFFRVLVSGSVHCWQAWGLAQTLQKIPEVCGSFVPFALASSSALSPVQAKPEDSGFRDSIMQNFGAFLCYSVSWSYDNKTDRF